MRIGILGTENSFKAHKKILLKCGVDGFLINNQEELDSIDGLIISGSDGAPHDSLIKKYKLENIIWKKTYGSIPIFGVGAGIATLAKEINRESQFYWGLMDIGVRFNSFSSQGEKLEVKLGIDAIGKAPFPGVFINAPFIEWFKPNVGILAEYAGAAVLVRQGNFLAASFHPELTEDLRVHLYFKQMIEDAKS